MEELTRSQLMIMKCVWDYDGNISYMELMDDLRERFGKDYHRSTLVTFLAQMEEKGYVEYSFAAEPPVQCGESHLSRLTEPLLLLC